MKREIKFRAWDGERMIYLSDLSIGLKKSKKISPYAYFSTDTFGNHVKLEHHELMQFTGLKDKNGKEIYEGDIINHPVCERGKVVYFEPYASFKVEKGDFLYDINMNEESEIIGNIYQNPELI
jgi:uncharacterized phage protein (TIGR01671 family)